jgi:hypothetical protein
VTDWGGGAHALGDRRLERSRWPILPGATLEVKQSGSERQFSPEEREELPDRRELNTERSRGQVRAEARVPRHGLPRERLRVGRPHSEKRGVELEDLRRCSCELHPRRRLSSYAVKDAAQAALAEREHESGGVAREARRRAHVDGIALPDRERPSLSERVDERRDEVAEARVLSAGESAVRDASP